MVGIDAVMACLRMEVGAMPKETFWNPAVVEGQEDERKFSVAWGSQQPIDMPIEVANVPMDRSGINRLIRVLRTARDKTYGRDE